MIDTPVGYPRFVAYLEKLIRAIAGMYSNFVYYSVCTFVYSVLAEVWHEGSLRVVLKSPFLVKIGD
jgi:hypothetical protein